MPLYLSRLFAQSNTMTQDGTSNISTKPHIHSNSLMVCGGTTLSNMVMRGEASFCNGKVSVDSVLVASNISLRGDIVPTGNRTQNIGSSNFRFKEAWVDTLHIASNTWETRRSWGPRATR